MLYDPSQVMLRLAEAKAAILALKSIPYQKDWVQDLQQMELKREVAGTTRIEGAEFTDQELEEALKEGAEQLFTRSQRQVSAAMQTYRWIATIPGDQPINDSLIREIHSRIITGADDDHCEPGRLRTQDQNVSFGSPRHSGVAGGNECEAAFNAFVTALHREYRQHDPIIQALAAHYHFAAMHPFLDGNGRAARALEALMLQRTGWHSTCFVAMSNYYYDEKLKYLTALSEVRRMNHDLTPFLLFGLEGIRIQTERVMALIQYQMKKALYRNLMFHLFGLLKTPKKRVIAERQLEILKVLLKEEKMEMDSLFNIVSSKYNLKKPVRAFIRDINGLLQLKAIRCEKTAGEQLVFFLRLEWPTEITETEFFRRLEQLPKAKGTFL